VQHGFTGTPKEMRWLGEYLNGRGYTVCGMRLTGHATQPKDMIRSRYSDWLASVEDGFHMLRSCTEQVFLLGLSMGGILSLISATQLPVRGVVAMSTPYKLPNNPLLKYAKLLSKFIPFISYGDGEPGAGWFGDAWKEHVCYPQNPVRSIAELNEAVGIMRAALPEIRVPVLLVSSRDDSSFVVSGMDAIYEALGTSDKQKVWIEGSGHNIVEEPKREFVFKTAADFIERVSQA